MGSLHIGLTKVLICRPLGPKHENCRLQPTLTQSNCCWRWTSVHHEFTKASTSLTVCIAWQCLRIWRAGSMHNVSIAFLSWLVSVHYTRRLHRRRVVSPNVMHKPHVSDTPYDARDTRVNDSERALSAPRMRRADSNGGSDRVSAAWHMKSRNPYCWKTREVSQFFL